MKQEEQKAQSPSIPIIEFDIIDHIHFTRKLWKDHKTAEEDISHFILGIISEVGEIATAFKKVIAYNKELDTFNIKEELGDILYYASRATDFIYGAGEHIVIPNVITTDAPVTEVLLYMCNTAFSLHECCTKLLTTKNIYSIRTEAINPLITLYSSINHIATLIGSNFSEIIEMNKNKLKVRHGNRFNENAVDAGRDTEKEKEAMTGRITPTKVHAKISNKIDNKYVAGFNHSDGKIKRMIHRDNLYRSYWNTSLGLKLNKEEIDRDITFEECMSNPSLTPFFSDSNEVIYDVIL